MIKEAKNIDFYTTGRQPSEKDFAQISEWIKKNKSNRPTQKSSKNSSQKKPLQSNRTVPD